MSDSPISPRLYSRLNDVGQDRLSSLLSTDALRQVRPVANYPANLARTTIMGGTSADVAALVRHIDDPELLALAVTKHKNQLVRFAVSQQAAVLSTATKATLLVWFDGSDKSMEDDSCQHAFERVIDECTAQEIYDIYTSHPKALSSLSYTAGGYICSRLVEQFAKSNDADLLVRFAQVPEFITPIAPVLRRVFEGEFPGAQVADLIATCPDEVVQAVISNGIVVPAPLAQLIADRGLHLLPPRGRLRSTTRTIEILLAAADYDGAKLIGAFSYDIPMLRAVIGRAPINDAVLFELSLADVSFEGLDETLCTALEERLSADAITPDVIGAIYGMLLNRRTMTVSLVLRALDAYFANFIGRAAPTSSANDAQRALHTIIGNTALVNDGTIDLITGLEEVCTRHSYVEEFTAALYGTEVAMTSPWFESWLDRVPMRRLPSHMSTHVELIAERLNAAAGDDPARWDMVAALLPSWEGSLTTFIAIIEGLDVK
jgi:hypothetical protein